MRAFSFRTRLTLIHLAVIVVVLLCAALAGHYGLSRAVHAQLDAALLALAETEMAVLVRGEESQVRIHEAPPGPQPPSFSRLDRLVQIVDAEGRVLARSANLGKARLPAPPALLARLAEGETVFETLPAFGEEPTRMVSVPVHARGSLFAVQVAGSLDDVNNVVQSASILFLVMGLALLATVGTAGILLARRAFARIDDIVRQAHRIGETNLSDRLPHPGTPDEIGHLVDTLNEMLGRLEQSFEVQRRFTADASHELRSPLSRLRTELEVTLRRPREAAEYVETLRSCLEEVERLTRLMEELLLLARLDANQERPESDAVPLNPLAAEVINRFEALARERQVQLALEASPLVSAQARRDQVGLVLTNLLRNAVKFSPAGGRVSVCLAADGAEAVLSVADLGPGIRADELPHIFERFYRGSSARTDPTFGVGLGLALSQAIVRAHGGRIEAANRPGGGALFTVRLPLAA